MQNLFIKKDILALKTKNTVSKNGGHLAGQQGGGAGRRDR